MPRLSHILLSDLSTSSSNTSRLLLQTYSLASQLRWECGSLCFWWRALCDFNYSAYLQEASCQKQEQHERRDEASSQPFRSNDHISYIFHITPNFSWFYHQLPKQIFTWLSLNTIAFSLIELLLAFSLNLFLLIASIPTFLLNYYSPLIILRCFF